MCGFRRISTESHYDFVLHDIPAPVVNHDITLFFQDRLSAIKRDCGFGLSTPWPDESTITLLVDRAAGLFIYASTTCRFIQHRNIDPQERLAIVLGAEHASNNHLLTKHLDTMYTQVLIQAVIGGEESPEHEGILTQFTKIVGTIIVLFDTMGAENLANLLNKLPNSVKGALSPLQSVLNIPKSSNEPIRLFHPSFRDFLVNPARCVDRRFWINEKERHIDLFRHCLELMSKCLHPNICDLLAPDSMRSQIPKETIQRAISSELKYACCFWINHFQQGQSIEEDNNQILVFLRTHLLHWLETLSLIGKISDGIICIIALEAFLNVSYNL